MRTYTFSIEEFSLVGSKKRELEIRARTERSAINKLVAVKGNRDWSWTVTKINGVDASKYLGRVR